MESGYGVAVGAGHWPWGRRSWEEGDDVGGGSVEEEDGVDDV